MVNVNLERVLDTMSTREFKGLGVIQREVNVPSRELHQGLKILANQGRVRPDGNTLGNSLHSRWIKERAN